MQNIRAQAWGFDVMISVIIFITGIITFFLFSLNFPNESQDSLENLLYEANTVADSLLEEGSPKNWDENNVVRIGLTNNNQINQTKLENLYEIVFLNNNYNLTRTLLDTKFNYFFNLSEPILFEGNPIPENGIGLWPQSGQSSTKNLIKISRLTIYQNKPVSLELYIWE
tara:strand:+ start:519 stop:1025 length:507 start_codon:yes stop_codon:yes gene_type:complete